LKKTLLFFIALSLILACGFAPSDLAPATDAPTASPTPSPSPTPIAPTWNDRFLVDAPFHSMFSNETPNVKRQKIYESAVVLNANTRWIIDVQVDKLTQDVGDASSGVVLLGYNKDGNIQALHLVYQRGVWALGYSPHNSNNQFIYWETFQELKSPAQRFELLISDGGANIALKNANGFQTSRTISEKFFDGAQTIVTNAQIGAQTKIVFSKIVVQQFRVNPVADASKLPTGLPTPTALAPANNLNPEYVFYVAPNGDNANSGSAEMPFASIEQARNVIRTISPTMKGPIIVYVGGGVYPLRDAIQFGKMDSGQNGYDIIYRAAEGANPVFSGGVTVAGWEQMPASLLWKTTLKDVKFFRQMYVNGVRAQRATSREAITWLGWAVGNFSAKDGIVISAPTLPNFSRPRNLELHWIHNWRDLRLVVNGLIVNADGTRTVLMKQPYFSYALSLEAGHRFQFPQSNAPFYLENAFELLDEPGEWYYNADTHELFYFPRPGENMNTAEVVIPQTQSLLEISGAAVGQEAHNIAFEGLTFAYAGWTRASEVGAFGLQAQSLLTVTAAQNDYEMTPAHIQVNSARNIRFEGCRFEHLGAVGLDLNNNVYQTTVRGNLFHDISDAAIVVGHWDHAYITAPSIQAASHDNLITNNLIKNVGVEYWGAPAVTAYYVNNLKIIHNEISNVPYTGISLGWGWAGAVDSTTSHDNLIANNLITDVLQHTRDGGGIYTLGQQPGTVIEGNVIRRVHDEFACLYPDEGSALITFQNNVCDTAPRWLFIWTNSIHDNKVFNSYTNSRNLTNKGVNIQIENTVYIDSQTWPPEAQAIIDNAGLEAAYSYLRTWISQ